MLLSARDDETGRMTDRQLRDEVLTSCWPDTNDPRSMSVDLYMLSRHPEVERSIAEESIAWSVADGQGSRTSTG